MKHLSFSMITVPCLLLVILLNTSFLQAQAAKPDPGASALQKRLFRDFDQRLGNFKNYQKTVHHECRMFPEGDLFPYSLTLMAYAWRIKANPQLRAELKPITDELITASIKAVEWRVNGRRPLTELKDYRKQAVYLGQLLLTLEVCFQSGLAEEHHPLADHLAKLFSEALTESKGEALHSFPRYSWTFDTVPPVLGLYLNDQRKQANTHQKQIQAHLDWMKKFTLDPDTKLPVSRWANGRILAPARGCDLSWRIALLSQIDRELARSLYQRYQEHYWTKALGVEGYREWPKGIKVTEDLDSGPMLGDLGTSATILGMAPARALGDLKTFELILKQQATLQGLFKIAGARFDLPGNLKVKQEYESGFLFGDVVLIYVVNFPLQSPKP